MYRRDPPNPQNVPVMQNLPQAEAPMGRQPSQHQPMWEEHATVRSATPATAVPSIWTTVPQLRQAQSLCGTVSTAPPVAAAAPARVVRELQEDGPLSLDVLTVRAVQRSSSWHQTVPSTVPPSHLNWIPDQM
ncbi:hypothetical protein HPB48_002470 [Haemaphysalis longicornis]|uniref:Uncharacterized protein n=1 Tax=Haemaphysalis longicornis TaxID=44386 RepID=A0A9J6G6Q9_HAELO|nr:hypothetical protein HPB48_002470 [Haemaphysalis longicornis]